MNVFVLNAGRSGSVTFIQACRHITNYSSGHESRAGLLGSERFAYPPDHIEADNRLSWFLGRLDRSYGMNALYVHLRRDNEATARSFVKRYSGGIIRAYRKTMLMGLPHSSAAMDVARDYCDTVNSNIELFLKDKPEKMDFSLEQAQRDFPKFWQLIGAHGDLAAALAEFDQKYNASETPANRRLNKKPVVSKLAQALVAIRDKLGLHNSDG